MQDWSGIEAITQRLRAHLGGEAVHIATMLQAQMAPYAELPIAELLPGVTTSLRFGITGLEERRLPSPRELEQLVAVAEARARQGIPLDLVLSAYRLGAHQVWSTALAEAQCRGIDPATLLEAVQLVWAWTDEVTTHAAGAHRRAELELARHHQQHRTDFLRALVTGSLTMPELSTQALSHGLDPKQPYRAFRAQATPSTPLYVTERTLTEGGAIVVGIIDGDLSGVAIERIAPGGNTITVGTGPPTLLPALPASFATATMVLRSAAGFAMTGVFDLEDLGLRIPISAENTVGDMLVERHLHPLRRLRQGGAGIEDGVRAFLAEGMRIEPAARRLFIHPNTLRYRLGRFQELTGTDLGKTETLVEVWWALQRNAFLEAEATPGGEASTSPS